MTILYKFLSVIPAQAGIHFRCLSGFRLKAGMTLLTDFQSSSLSMRMR
jgi:hypothetical protein